MSLLKGLRCRECHREYPAEALHVCEFCFGPLEVTYDYERAAKTFSRATIESRKPNMWRYRELLPIEGDPTVGLEVGFTPFFKARALGERFGVKELYIKNDGVNHPTLSFKDRVVAVALSRARELGYNTVACASTGNLANSVAANAAASGLNCYVFIPSDLEHGKILTNLVYGAKVVAIKGTYDEVNRLCSEVAGKYGWAFVNINIRAYYAEGSKSFAYEVAEQMGWRAPQNIVVPMASGSLLTKIAKGFGEFAMLGLIEESHTRYFGAQPTGCSPISEAVKADRELFRPVRPKTLVKSLAIGNPADGFYAINTIRKSGGWAEDATDDEVVDAIQLLAETEGIFTEPAGGTTVAVAKKLIEQGKISRDESVVLCITGNGLKTLEAIEGRVNITMTINAKLAEFDAIVGSSEEPVGVR